MSMNLSCRVNTKKSIQHAYKNRFKSVYVMAFTVTRSLTGCRREKEQKLNSGKKKERTK